MKKWIGLTLPVVLAVQALAADDFAVGCPAGGGGPRIVYLSQAMPGACNDALALQNLIFQIGQTGMLVVDKACTLSAGLRLPSRFTLRGVGMGGAGVIAFSHDGTGISVCQEAPRGYVTIQELDLYGPYTPERTAPNSTGIALANLNIVHLTKVRVSDFHTGVTGSDTYSVFINGSNISNNRGTNIVVGYGSNSWRIRDGLVSQAGAWGIDVRGPGDAPPLSTIEGLITSSNDLLIDGVRMESNRQGAVRTNAYGTRIENTRLEGNGKGAAPLNRGILVAAQAVESRILTNYLSSDCMQIAGAGTMRSFNMPAAANIAVCGP